MVFFAWLAGWGISIRKFTHDFNDAGVAFGSDMRTCASRRRYLLARVMLCLPLYAAVWHFLLLGAAWRAAAALGLGVDGAAHAAAAHIFDPSTVFHPAYAGACCVAAAASCLVMVALSRVDRVTDARQTDAGVVLVVALVPWLVALLLLLHLNGVRLGVADGPGPRVGGVGGVGGVGDSPASPGSGGRPGFVTAQEACISVAVIGTLLIVYGGRAAAKGKSSAGGREKVSWRV
jgi:hypothetical protein